MKQSTHFERKSHCPFEDDDSDEISASVQDIDFSVTKSFKRKGDHKDYPLRSKFQRKDKSQVDRDYNENNRSKLNEKAKGYCERSKEKKNYYDKEYRKNNEEKTKDYSKGYYEQNKDKLKAKRQERYNAKKNNANVKAEKMSKKFKKSLDMTIVLCQTCKEAWPLGAKSWKSNVENFECSRCKKEKESPKRWKMI